MNQELLSISIAVLILVCLVLPIFFKNELEGSEDKYYLLAFYVSTIIHFLTVVNPSSGTAPLLELSKSVSVINAALLPFWLSAFVCVREARRDIFRIVVALAAFNLAAQYFYPKTVYIDVAFAFASNLLGFIVVISSLKNKADLGLAACFGGFSLALLAVLVEAPFDITPAKFYTNFYAWLLVFIPGFICGTTVFIFLNYVLELNKELATQARIDLLTGVANRRFSMELIDRQITYIKRNHSEACVIMADIDHFKQVNDTFGHRAGDEAIKQFANIIKSEVREYDIVCRYGGEEFLLFLPDTSVEEAHSIAERIRTKVSNTEIVCDNHKFIVTSSFGISGGIPSLTLDNVIENSDNALYQAKQNGRNKAVIFKQ